MATVTWTNTAGGNWTTGADWSSTPNPPAAGDDVTVGVAGNYTVTLNSSIGVNSLTVSNASADLLIQTGGVATIATNVNDAGSILFQDGGSLSTTSGGLGITGNGRFSLDGPDVGGSGGSSASIGGTISISSSSGNAFNIGNTGITSADTVTASGLNSTGQINIAGSSTARSTLDITSGTASFGTANTETGTVVLSGNALLEFAGGQINTIAGTLELVTSSADVAEAPGGVTTNSALVGLNSVTGALFLQNGASIFTSGGLTDSGTTGRISLDGGDIGGNGGSTLTITGGLTIASTNGNAFNVGNTSISSADVVSALTLTSGGEITIEGSGTARSTLDITSGTASFGTANTETGAATLVGNALLEFAGGGQINTIAGGLVLVSSEADVADAGGLTTNSALLDLNSVTGALFLEDGASISTLNGLSDSVNGRISLDGGDIGGNGGSSLLIGGGLTITSANGNSFNVGSTGISSADVATAQTLTLNSASEITIAGSGTARSTLDITSGTASFGTANTETGAVLLNGNALLEFASGQINTIAGTVQLVSSGADVADAGNLTTNSALTGLNSVTGDLFEQNGASISTSGGLSDSGIGRISLDGGDLGGFGGSSLSIGGGLNITSTNGNSFNVGSTGISSADVATAQTLTLNSASEITVAGNSTARSTLDITSGTASFGTANTETGAVLLNGNALIEFAGGQINTIAGQLFLVTSGADVADAGNLTTNSALTGLNSVTGNLFLENGASVSTSGGLSDSGTARISLDGGDIGGFGGSSLSIGGGLNITSTNGNSFNVGSTGISSADVATAQTLTLNSASEITIAGSSTARSTLDITSGTASFGTANTETGAVLLNGNALIEFASGQINTIAGQLWLISSGADVADAGNLTTNSALTGLNSVTGNLFLEGGASISTSGGLSDSGSGRISLDGGDIGGFGGSSLSIGGGLTITSTNGNGFVVGNSGLTSADTATATGLTNSGLIQLTGGSSSATGNLLINGNATNTGSVVINNFGKLTVTGPGVYTQAGGTTEVGTTASGSSGQLNGVVNVTGGILDGTGTVVGTIENNGGGTVVGGLHNGQLGTLAVQGLYTQSGTGIFEADLASGNTASVLTDTSGAIELDGGELLINPSVTLAAGQVYTIMTFAPNSFFGEFSSVVDGAFTGDGSHVDIGGGLTLDVNYNQAAGNVQIAVVSTPSSNADTWNTTTGTWTTAGDWTNGVPNNSSNVVIGSVANGDPTLNVDATINSLDILGSDTLQAASQTLTVATTVTVAASGTLNIFDLNVGGAITDAGNVTVSNNGVLDLTGNTMTVSGGLTLNGGEVFQGTLAGAGTMQNVSTGTLQNVTIAAGATFTSLNSTNTDLYGTITDDGNIDINATSNGTNVRIFGPVTLAGTGFLTLSNVASTLNTVSANNGTDTLTIAAGITVQGAGTFGNGSMGIANAGTIDANVTNALDVQPNASIGLTNTGTMEATSGGTLQLIGAGFNNAGGLIDAATGSTVTLDSASIAGGNFTTAGTGIIETVAGTTSLLTSITLTTGSDLTVVNSSTLDLAGTITDNGTINLDSTGNGTDIRIFGAVTLTGTGSLTLSNNSNNVVLANNGETLTIASGITVQGGGTFGDANMGIVNQGLIDANVATALIVQPISTTGLTNTGTMEATSGGTLELMGTGFNNAGGLIDAATGSTVTLDSASITGGNFTTAGTGIIETVAGTTSSLTSITLTTGSDLTVVNSSTLDLSGTITDNGTINLDSTGNGTDIRIFGAVTLTGTGSLTLSNNANNLVLANNGETLTIASGITVQGGGTFGDGNMGIINQGLIDANVGTALIVQPNSTSGLTNTGTMEATNGGTMQLIGPGFNNAGGLIEALNSTTASTVELDNAAITGGTLTTTGNGIIETESGQFGSLANLTLSTGSNLDVVNNSTLQLTGTITDGGTINLNGAANDTVIRIFGPVTLAGNGSLTMSNSVNNEVFANNGTDTLTISSGFTVQGGGLFGDGGMGIVNQGLIDANVAAVLTVDPGSSGLINTGTMEATNGGTLQLTGAGFNNNNGLIDSATGTVVELSSATIAGGTLTTAGTGIIETENGTTSSLTTITLSTGSDFTVVNNSTLQLTGTITDGGTINLDSTGNGTIIRIFGAVTLAGGGSLTLSNNVNNEVIANNGTDTLTISSGNTVQGGGLFGDDSMGIVNHGVIDANVSTVLTVEPGVSGLINTGTMEATSGGTLQLTGAGFNNAGGLIDAATGTVVELSSASIAGGTFTSVGTGLIETEGGTTSSLTTITLTAGSNLTVVNTSILDLTGTITDNGTINLDSTGNGTQIQLSNAVTLAGTGTLTLSNNANNEIFANNDTNTLTISSGFTVQGGGLLGDGDMGLVNGGIIDADVSTNLVIQPNASETVTNQATGTMEGSGGTLVLQGGTFTNDGTVQALNGGAVTYAASATDTNDSGGTLTGGTWEAIDSGLGATVSITGGAVVTDAATIVLSGANSTFLAAGATLESSLTTIAATGELEILNDRNYTTSLGFTDGGIVQLGGGTFTGPSLTVSASALFSGFGTIDPVVIPTITNNGTIEASGGHLIVSNAVTGSGLFQISAAAELELGANTAENVAFIGADGELRLDQPTSYSGTIGGFSTGDTLELANTDATGAFASFNSGTGVSTLTVSLSGGGTLTYELSGNYSTDSFATTLVHSSTDTDITIGTSTGNAPVITAPTTLTVGVGKTDAISGVSLSESGSTGGETFTVTLGDTNGLLSANTSATGGGGTITGSASTSLTIAGTLGQVDADLTTLSDNDGTTPSDTITLNASDSFGNHAAAATIAVTVNGLPTIAAPTTLTVGVGEAETIGGVSLSESGNTTSESFTVTLSDSHGSLSANTSATGGGGTITGSASTSLTIAGTLGQVDADLTTLSDNDGTTPSDTITLNAGDAFGNHAAAATIAVTVNGLPVIAAPATATVGDGVATTIGGVSLSESGNTTSESFTVTLSDSHGSLSANTSATGGGGTITGSASTSLTIAGTLGQVDADLTTLSDNDGTTPSDTITLNAGDGFGNHAAAATIAVTVNGLPVIAAPATATVGDGVATTIGGVSLSESGNTTSESFTVTLSDSHGSLSANTSATGGGGTITGSASTSLTIAGTLGQVDADLTTLSDNDGTTPSDTITLNAGDGFGNHATAATIAVTVTSGPVIAAPTTLTVGVGEAETIAGVSLSESGSTPSESFTVTLSDSHGSLSANTSATGGGGTITGSPSTSLTIAGTLGQVDADLTTLSDNDGTTPSDTITLNASDAFGNHAAAATIAVTVNGLPVLSAPTTLTVGVGEAETISGVSLSESGNTTSESFTVTLSDSHGSLSANTSATGGGGTITGSASTSLTIAGTLGQVDADLTTLSDNDGTTPSDTITLNAGDGFGNHAAAATIAVTVNGLPVITAPTTATVAQGVATGIGGVSLAESGNTGSETFTVTLSDSSGDLSASGSGITGNGTTSLTITGSLGQVNGDLATLTDTDGSAASDMIAVNASDSFANIAAAKDIAVSVTPSAGQTFTFTTGVDNFHGGAANDTFIATTGTLNAGDVADGGGGTNTLELEGGGTFNLAAPTTLADIQFITAQEGQPAYNGVASQVQTIDLRNGLNATVEVEAATLTAGNNKVPTIDIVGANNADIIDLASGNDVVTLGSAAETVNGGSGVGAFYVTSSTIGATINGGTSGQSELLATGGGAMQMGGNITNVAVAYLEAATTSYQFFANAIGGFTVDDLDATTADTINAGGAGQTLTGGGAGKETMVGFGSGVTTYKDSAATFNNDTIDNFSALDQIDVTGLAATGTTVSWQFNSSTATPSGTLDVFHNGALATAITLFGTGLSATTSFTPTTDGAGTGTLITDPQHLAAAH